MSFTQCLAKPSHQVQDPYADIVCNQVIYSLLGASEHLCEDYNNARRILPKRQHCSIPVFTFVVCHPRVAVFQCAVMSRETKVMYDVLLLYIVANVDAPYDKWILCFLHIRLFSN